MAQAEAEAQLAAARAFSAAVAAAKAEVSRAAAAARRTEEASAAEQAQAAKNAQVILLIRRLKVLGSVKCARQTAQVSCWDSTLRSRSACAAKPIAGGAQVAPLKGVRLCLCCRLPKLQSSASARSGRPRPARRCTCLG